MQFIDQSNTPSIKSTTEASLGTETNASSTQMLIKAKDLKKKQSRLDIKLI